MRRTLSMLATVLALVAVMALGLPAQPASAARPSKPPDLQCGVVPTTDVVLRADLTCDSTLILYGSGSAAGHTIDLGGHTWAVSSSVGVALRDHSGVTVKNGTIVGSVVADRWLFYSPLTLSRVHVTGSVTSGYYGSIDVSRSEVGGVSVSGFVNVHDSVVHGGVSVNDTDQDAGLSIVDNTIEGPISASRAFDFNTVRGTIAGNHIWGAGIRLDDVTAQVSGNTIVGSTGDGISSRRRPVPSYQPVPTEPQVVLTGNVVRQSGRAGIRLDDATARVSGNTVVGSTGDGIEYHQAGPASLYDLVVLNYVRLTLTGNILRHNGGHGIDVVGPITGERAGGVVDGGGNRANNNALNPQCIQIPCGPPDARAIPDVTWNPANLGIGLPLGPDQLNATASVPGTFTYDPPAGGLYRTIGSHVLSVHFVPDDLANYQPVDRAVWFYVADRVRPLPTITWANPADITYGTPVGPDQLDATADMPGTFTYDVAPGTLLQPGPHDLHVAFSPDDWTNYGDAHATVTLLVLPPPDESLTWDPPTSLPFGTTLGPAQLNATATVPGTFAYTPAAGTVLPAGVGQHLSVVFTPDDLTHYVVMSKTVTVEVLPKVGPRGSVAFAPLIETITGADISTDTQLADVDGDGTLDLITSHPTAWGHGASAQVRLGAGDGTFPARADTVVPLANGGHLVAAGDVNGDGDPDLVATNHSPDSISIMLGHGDGTFADRVDQPAGAGQGGLVLVDIDGDGILDVVESNFWTPTVSVLIGHGDGSFAEKVDYPVGAGPMRLVGTDLDGDGHVDLAVPNQFAGTVSVLMGAGDGTFSAKSDLVVGHAPLGVAALDLDHDNHMDLAVTNSGDSSVSVLRGDGAGGFAGRTDYVTPVAPGPVVVADFNGDGELDLAVGLSVSAAGAKSVAIWTGTGTLALGPRTDIVAGVLPKVLAVGDLDGDGRPDLAVDRPLAGKLSVVLNRTPPP